MTIERKLPSSHAAHFLLNRRAMTDETAKLSLLPNGFVDLLPPKAEGEAQSISTLMKKFKAFGYERVKPPLLEFEESLLGAATGGAKLAPETFRLMDPVSHRMLGVRSDITPQIARIASSRLGHRPRPLRLTYANDALRTRGSQMRTERQFTQVGCEIIGDDGVQTDIEICVLAILGLKALGLKTITLDFTIPGFVKALAPQASVELLRAVAQRDYAAVLKESKILAQALTQGIQGLDLPEALAQDAAHLRQVYDGVQLALRELEIADVALSLDMLEQAGFEYHKRLGFTLFADGVHGELGRGGCYAVRFGEASEMAKGFTLYMDTISRAVPMPQESPMVFVSAKEPWSVMAKLQQEGHVTLRGNDEDANAALSSHVYKDGKILERKKEK